MEVNKTDSKAIEPIKEENEDENENENATTESPEKKKEATASPSKAANPAKKTEGSPTNATAN